MARLPVRPRVSSHFSIRAIALFAAVALTAGLILFTTTRSKQPVVEARLALFNAKGKMLGYCRATRERSGETFYFVPHPKPGSREAALCTENHGSEIAYQTTYNQSANRISNPRLVLSPRPHGGGYTIENGHRVPCYHVYHEICLHGPHE